MSKSSVRKPNRLKNYDYSQKGAYFITICVKDKHEILGKIVPVGAITNRPSIYYTNRPNTNQSSINQSKNRPHNNHQQNETADKLHVELSEYGMIVDTAINEIPVHYKNVSVDRYVIMPNHIHLILVIQNNNEIQHYNATQHNVGNGRLLIAPTCVSNIVKQLKRYVSKQLGFSLWQKSFHDHIIRNEKEYCQIVEYIENNPSRWVNDCYYKP